MIRVFFSYAHEDADLLDDLVDRHMGPLVRSGRIEPWVDRRALRAGHEWQRRITDALAEADLIVLLLTSAFFRSDFVADVELKIALQRRERGEAEVVPVLVKRVTQSNRRVLDALQIVPGPDAPIYGRTSSPAEIEDAWVEVTEQIEHVVDELTGLAGFPDEIARDLLAYYRSLPDGEALGRPRRLPAEKATVTSRRGTTGYRWAWQTGSIYWTPGGLFVVRGALATAYIAAGGPSGILGLPESVERDALDADGRPAGRCQRFTSGGSLYLRSGDAHAYMTAGWLGQTYEQSGGPAGPLGFPQSDEGAVASVNGTIGFSQRYEHGGLYASVDKGPYAVLGRLHAAYIRLGGPEGRFGSPVGPVSDDGGDVTQEFEGGVIALAREEPKRPPPSHLVVAAGSLREGHQELFAAFPDGRVVHRSHHGGGWSNWATFDTAPPPGALTTVASRNGTWAVVYSDGEAPAVALRWRHNERWSDWDFLATPRPVVSLAAAGYRADGHQIFMVADDGRLYHVAQRNAAPWSRWTWFEAPGHVRRVVAGRAVAATLEVVTLDVEGELRLRQFRDDIWSDWERITVDGRVVAQAYGVRRDGPSALFVALDDGRLLYRQLTPADTAAWHDFGSVGSVVDLAASSQSGRELEVFAATADGRLVHRWYRPALDDWSPWTAMDLP